MSLFAELKRRNVFRVAAAYVVTAWLLIEVGNTLEETLRLPEWADTLLAFFLILGFLPVLFFSWAYEITPEGIRREKDIEVDEAARSVASRKLNRLIVVVMALALAYFAVDKWLLTDQLEPVTESAPPTAGAQATDADEDGDVAPVTDGQSSIAVLPFANMSADPDNEYFSDGISEELLNLLVDIDGLRVPSRTSSFAFKGMNMDIREIAEQLEVGHILEGSVRKAGNRVRVTAQLIDVSSDTHLWSGTYDRELEDIFAIQDEIARNIVQELRLMLGAGDDSGEDRRPTADIEAYNLYLRGLYLFRQRGDALLEAERILEETVVRDPAYAEAWGLLALVRIIAPAYFGEPAAEAEPSVLEAVDRALRLQPGNPDALLARAQVMEARGNWSEALALFEDVTEAHPKLAQARLWFGITLLSAGYLDDGLTQLRESVRLDPVAPTNIDWLGRGLVVNGLHEEGVATAQQAVALGRYQGALAIQESALTTGRFDLFREAMPPELGLGLEHYENVFALLDKPGRYEEFVAWAENRAREIGSQRLLQYALLEYALAAQRPEESYRALMNVLEFDRSIVSQLWLAKSAWFTRHPLGKQFMVDSGLVDLWRERGWPDRCRPIGAEDFECD